MRGRPREERSSILLLGRGRGALDDSFHDPVDLGLTSVGHHHFGLKESQRSRICFRRVCTGMI